MKKSNLTYGCLFLFIFLFHWFLSELNSLLTPFLLIFIYPPILLLIVGMLVCSVILFTKKRKLFRWRALSSFLITVVLIVILLYFPFEKAKVYTEFILYTTQREKVVAMIADDPSFADPRKRKMTLPLRYRYLSCDGEVVVVHKYNKEEVLVVGFWVFRGLSVNGYSMVYYTSTGEEETIRHLTEDDILSLTKLNDYWYYVVTD